MGIPINLAPVLLGSGTRLLENVPPDVQLRVGSSEPR
jgi:hypothetical protein